MSGQHKEAIGDRTDGPDEIERQRLIQEYQDRVHAVRRKGIRYLLIGSLLVGGNVGLAFVAHRILVWLFALGFGMGAWGLILAVIPRLVLEHFSAADE